METLEFLTFKYSRWVADIFQLIETVKNLKTSWILERFSQYNEL